MCSLFSLNFLSILLLLPVFPDWVFSPIFVFLLFSLLSPCLDLHICPVQMRIPFRSLTHSSRVQAQLLWLMPDRVEPTPPHMHEQGSDKPIPGP